MFHAYLSQLNHMFRSLQPETLHVLELIVYFKVIFLARVCLCRFANSSSSSIWIRTIEHTSTLLVLFPKSSDHLRLLVCELLGTVHRNVQQRAESAVQQAASLPCLHSLHCRESALWPSSGQWDCQRDAGQTRENRKAERVCRAANHSLANFSRSTAVFEF